MLCGPPLTSTMLCPPTCGWLQERQRGYKKKNFIQVGAGLCGMGMRRRLWVGHRGGCVPCIHPPASLPPCLTAPLFRARFPPIPSSSSPPNAPFLCLPPSPPFLPQAKYDFVEEMLRWSGWACADVSGDGGVPKILDVGCGIGGTSRYLAAKFPQASVTGGPRRAGCLAGCEGGGLAGGRAGRAGRRLGVRRMGGRRWR